MGKPDPAALRMMPFDRDFAKKKPCPARPRKQFDVKGPAPALLRLEQGSACGQAEGFEATLGVPIGEADNPTDEEIEDLPGSVAPGGLRRPDPGIGRPT